MDPAGSLRHPLPNDHLANRSEDGGKFDSADKAAWRIDAGRCEQVSQAANRPRKGQLSWWYGCKSEGLFSWARLTMTVVGDGVCWCYGDETVGNLGLGVLARLPDTLHLQVPLTQLKTHGLALLKG
jgi:hypothetical protein